MKLDTHNFNSSHQNEDVLDVAEEMLGKDPALFNAPEKTSDSSQTEVGDHDGFWQVSGFDSYDSVYSNSAENITTEVKGYEALNCHPCENSRQIDEMHLFSDRSKNELEVPELVICYKESCYLDVKDICVDENMPSCERIFFEADVEKEDHCSLLLLEKAGSNDLTTETIEFSDPTPNHSKFCEDQDSESPDIQVHSEEIGLIELKVHEVAEYVSIGQMLSKEQGSATEFPPQKLSSEDTCGEDTQMPLKELGIEEISKGLALTSADEETANISHAEESSNDNLSHPEGEIPASPCEESNRIIPASELSNGFDRVSSGIGNQENQVPDQNIPKVHDSWEGSFRDQHSLGETSFSMSGPVSGLITYSGPIAYSGSLSLRSDSTTSTRSFAFPILQSEWQSSPVRMAKADRRRFRKHGGWRQGLLCCRF